MMSVIKKVVIVSVVVIGFLGMYQASANETMFNLFIKAQDFTEYQEELAIDLVKSAKELSVQVKKPKHQLKEFVQGLVDTDQLDVEEMMQAYKAWQADVDSQVHVTLTALAKLHADLTPEQKQTLMETIKKMKSH